MLNPLLFQTTSSRFDRALHNKKIRGRQTPYFIFISLVTESGDTVGAIYDSGALNCVIESKLLRNKKTIIEVVGGLEQTQQTFEVLLHLEGCDDDYQLTSAVSVKSIVSPIPNRDLSVVMLEAYQEYLAHCTRLGDPPISHDNWPSGSYGGNVEILLGWEICFTFKGLFFR